MTRAIGAVLLLIAPVPAFAQRDHARGGEDGRMTRLNLVLLVAVIASALFLVRTQYESRRPSPCCAAGG